MTTVSTDPSRRRMCSSESDEAEGASKTSSAETSSTASNMSRADGAGWEGQPNDADRSAADAAKNMSGGPSASSGVTPNGRNVRAEAALVKTNEDGVELEAVSGSVQAGAQNQAQVTTARATVTGGRGSASAEAGTANVHAGIENSDGSVGWNVGAGVNVLAAEATLKGKPGEALSGNSVTAGVSFGSGLEAHVGVRDEDGDGKPEACVRLGGGPFTFGLCIEVPVVIHP